MEYITPYGMTQIQKRIKVLAEERPSVMKAIGIAREMGDLSENAEYKSARERQRQIDNEVNYLKLRSSRITVIDPATIPKDSVRFGAIIEGIELDINEPFCFQLVGVDEVNFIEDGAIKVSVASPIGKGFIGKKVGETTVIKVPKGDRLFKIESIR
ncbi:MAG: transcription elongation factor [Candidatus Cloacimonetes bacterium 4572_65]|nr:MAG: transcription elongation factor [Candidatus Cloacimonetes bacterium 4572_65]